jgi:hypothetical protein
MSTVTFIGVMSSKLVAVFDDTERPARVRAEQDRALRQYVRRQVYPYSAHNRQRLVAAGISPGGIQSAADLRRVAPVTWAEVDDGADLVLRPQETTITRLGSPGLAFRVLFAKLMRRKAVLSESLIDPLYRPIRWIVQDGVPVGYTANDLERLGEIGRRWLQAAGVRPDDVIVSLVPAGPHLDFWELTAASRRAGVATVFLDSTPVLEDLRRIHPTVLAGRASDLLALAAAAGGDPALAAVHTVLVTGDLIDEDTRFALRRQLGGAEVVVAWAPSGVRALWAECRGGVGLHTWPAAEIVEVESGEIMWSALGWAGTVVVRLATGARGALEESTCPQCGRTTPRVLPVVAAPFDTGDEKAIEATFAEPVPDIGPVLDAHPGVGAWQAELSRRDGSDELVVYLAASRPGHPGRLVRELDERLQPVHAPAQFVVMSRDALDQRLADHNNGKLLDHRMANR